MYGTKQTVWYRYYGVKIARYCQTLTECAAQNTKFDFEITVWIKRVNVKHLRNVRHRTQSFISILRCEYSALLSNTYGMYGTEHTVWYRYYGVNKASYCQTLTECTAQNTQFDIDITVWIKRVTVNHICNVRHRTHSLISILRCE